MLGLGVEPLRESYFLVETPELWMPFLLFPIFVVTGYASTWLLFFRDFTPDEFHLNGVAIEEETL